jgi:hypothetical protein
MNQITARLVQNIYVRYIKYTSGLYSLDLTSNKYRAEPHRDKCSKEHYSFMCSRHVFS